MQINATKAENRFGDDLGAAERAPACAMKSDHATALIMCAARFAEPEVQEQKESPAQREQDFDRTYTAWLAAQEELVDRIGVFGEAFRPW